ncbi:Hypothetcial protein, related [Neospora caninum Liverpool]|uniref:Hypothetcial protein, related n=1 Tax=Neospora caninum (strain Liverpool) TaxID=572307 RepID=F0VDE9_NEOCL|nr:Hypothetcial protein, related [Neospora caninum Liverpool]CBZ51664.1 Hypothetcial protein, related [Neospora caninum Liverpool]CEL65618.1 TPA: Hypothetcial protein, related [Neospora caninum Liverpool]|eukprot:XP_003881697.1 Hypothetcial protein, related [Neospora caninum Liverpool]
MSRREESSSPRTGPPDIRPSDPATRAVEAILPATAAQLSTFETLQQDRQSHNAAEFADLLQTDLAVPAELPLRSFSSRQIGQHFTHERATRGEQVGARDRPIRGSPESRYNSTVERSAFVSPSCPSLPPTVPPNSADHSTGESAISDGDSRRSWISSFVPWHPRKGPVAQAAVGAEDEENEVAANDEDYAEDASDQEDDPGNVLFADDGAGTPVGTDDSERSRRPELKVSRVLERRARCEASGAGRRNAVYASDRTPLREGEALDGNRQAPTGADFVLRRVGSFCPPLNRHTSSEQILDAGRGHAHGNEGDTALKRSWTGPADELCASRGDDGEGGAESRETRRRLRWAAGDGTPFAAFPAPVAGALKGDRHGAVRNPAHAGLLESRDFVASNSFPAHVPVLLNPRRNASDGALTRGCPRTAYDGLKRRPTRGGVRPWKSQGIASPPRPASSTSIGSGSRAQASPAELFQAVRRGLYRQAIGEFRAGPIYRNVAGIFTERGALTRRELEREFVYRTATYAASNHSRAHLQALQETVTRMSGGMQLEVLPHDVSWAEQNPAIASRSPEEVARLSDLLEYPRMLSTLDEETVNWLGRERNRGYWFERLCLYILSVTVLVSTQSMEDLFAEVIKYECAGWIFFIYAAALFLVCLPIMAFELAIGEATRASTPYAYWSLCKRARGLGIFMCLIVLFCDIVPFSRRPAECLVYLVESFRPVQPWRLTDQEVRDCRQFGMNEALCNSRSYCVFSEERGYCVPYNLGKSAVMYSQRFGCRRESSRLSPYHLFASLNSLSLSAPGLVPRTAAMAAAARIAPGPASLSGTPLGDTVRDRSLGSLSRGDVGADAANARGDSDSPAARGSQAPEREGEEETQPEEQAEPRAPKPQREEDGSEQRGDEPNNENAPMETEREEAGALNQRERSENGGEEETETSKQGGNTKLTRGKNASSDIYYWGGDGPDFHLLCGIAAAWLLASYLYILGGSTLSIVCAGVLSLWAVLALGEIGFNERIRHHFFSGVHVFRSPQIFRAIGSPSLWTTAILTAARDLWVGVGLFCTLGARARVGQNVMAEATGATVTSIAASLAKSLAVASAICFAAKPLGISANLILRDAPSAHIFIVYPVAVFLNEPFERIMATAVYTGATILLTATLSLLVLVLVKALQECALCGQSWKHRTPFLLVFFLFLLSLPQATFNGRYVVALLRKYVGAAGHLWCCLGICVFVGWCHGLREQSRFLGQAAVYLYAILNWSSMLALAALWVLFESPAAFCAYWVGSAVVCVASAYVLAVCAPMLQDLWEAKKKSRDPETGKRRAPASHNAHALTVQDRMWWLMIGNTEVLRLEFARVISGHASVCGFTVLWSICIKWLAPCALVPSVISLALHHCQLFLRESMQDSLHAASFGLACAVWAIAGLAFLYCLFWPNGIRGLHRFPSQRLLPLSKLPDNLGPALGTPTSGYHPRLLFAEFYKDACSPTARLMAYMYCAKADNLLTCLQERADLDGAGSPSAPGGSPEALSLLHFLFGAPSRLTERSCAAAAKPRPTSRLSSLSPRSMDAGTHLSPAVKPKNSFRSACPSFSPKERLDPTSPCYSAASTVARSVTRRFSHMPLYARRKGGLSCQPSRTAACEKQRKAPPAELS